MSLEEQVPTLEVSSKAVRTSNPALESAKYIMGLAQDVSIDQQKVDELSVDLRAKMETGELGINNWGKHELNPSTPDENTADWVFVVDTLNFSFWNDDGSPVRVEYKGRMWSGYWSLVACINRALDVGIPITTPSFYASVTDDDMSRIMRTVEGDPPCPLLAERAAALREAGGWLVGEHGGRFRGAVVQCGGDAVALSVMLATTLQSYADSAEYAGRPVSFNKRAQICVADLWAAHNGEGIGAFTNVDSLTIFADYRLPQALALRGALVYSPSLVAILQAGEDLPPGSRLEGEVRAGAIVAAQMAADGGGVCAVLLDFFMWDWIKSLGEEELTIPMHRTRSVYY